MLNDWHSETHDQILVCSPVSLLPAPRPARAVLFFWRVATAEAGGAWRHWAGFVCTPNLTLLLQGQANQPLALLQAPKQAPKSTAGLSFFQQLLMPLKWLLPSGSGSDLPEQPMSTMRQGSCSGIKGCLLLHSHFYLLLLSVPKYSSTIITFRGHPIHLALFFLDSFWHSFTAAYVHQDTSQGRTSLHGHQFV